MQGSAEQHLYQMPVFLSNQSYSWGVPANQGSRGRGPDTKASNWKRKESGLGLQGSRGRWARPGTAPHCSIRELLRQVEEGRGE